MTQVPKVAATTKSAVLCRMLDIEDGAAVAVEHEIADGVESLVVLRQGDSAYVYRNVCPHNGRRLDWAPGRFLVKDGVLVCAAHGASFVSDSGLCIGGPCRGESLTAIPVRVVDGDVCLDISDAGPVSGRADSR